MDAINLGILEFRGGNIKLLSFYSGTNDPITPSIIKTGKQAKWVTPENVYQNNNPTIQTNINNLITLFVDKRVSRVNFLSKTSNYTNIKKIDKYLNVVFL